MTTSPSASAITGIPDEPAAHPAPHLDRALLIAAVVAVVVPAELVARAAARPQGWWEVVARSSVASLAVVAIGVGAVVRACRSGRESATWLAAALGFVVTVRTLAWALLGGSWVDPLGHGVLLPDSTPVLVAAAVLVVVVAAGLALPRLAHRVPAIAAVAATVIALLTLAVVDEPTVAALASLVLAVALGVGAHRSSDTDGVLGTRSAWNAHTAGTALAALAVAPHAARFVLDRYVERVAMVDGAVVVLGPLAPPALWAGTLVVAVGVVLGLAVVLVDGWRRGDEQFGWRRWAIGPAAFVPVIVAVAYLFRIWALTTISTARRDSGDPFFYHVTANILAHGRGFEEPLTWISSGTEIPSALHGPALPAALALFSRLGGVSYVDHQWASILFGLPQIAFAVLLAHMLAGRRAALLTGAICIVYPNLWLTDGSLFVEGLAAGFTTAATWTQYRWIQRQRVGMIVLTGVLIGLAALTRGEALLLVPLFFGLVVLLLRSVPWRVRWTHALWGTAATVVTLAPWMIYNAPRFDVFVPLSTNSNEVLFYANCDDVYSGQFIGFWSFACQTRYREEFGEAPGDQAEQAVFWRDLAIEYIEEHRDQVPKVVVARVGRQWELFRPGQTIDFAFIEGRDRTSVRIGQLGYYVMMPLAIVGTIAMRRRRQPVLPMWSHAIGVTVTAIYAYGTLRFRAPWEPIMVTLAAIGLIFLWDRWRARGASGPTHVEATA
jgi:4-amino-4-deoxy-L-arabinose transferase-like glycosyltransferase